MRPRSQPKVASKKDHNTGAIADSGRSTTNAAAARNKAGPKAAAPHRPDYSGPDNTTARADAGSSLYMHVKRCFWLRNYRLTAAADSTANLWTTIIE